MFSPWAIPNDPRIVGWERPEPELELGVVFPHGRGAWHVDAGNGRTACGLELEGVPVQLSLVGDGGGECGWCRLSLHVK